MSEAESLCQYFTPHAAAKFMGELAVDDANLPATCRVLDAGAGEGALFTAFAEAVCALPESQRPRAIHVDAWEIDLLLAPAIRQQFRRCAKRCADHGVNFASTLRIADYLAQACANPNPETPYDVAILNPPYRKLGKRTPIRAMLDSADINTSNLYAAFVWAAVRMVKPGGRFVAITPRSFANGTYFKAYRNFLRCALAFRRIHAYGSRTAVFRAKNVLQEAIVFSADRLGCPANVELSLSESHETPIAARRTLAPSELFRGGMLNLAFDADSAQLAEDSRAHPASLADLDAQASTGRLLEAHTHATLSLDDSTAGDATAVVCTHHVSAAGVIWPKLGLKFNTVSTPPKAKPFPQGWYVLVPRFSPKERAQRVAAYLYAPQDAAGSHVHFTHKLNVIHRSGAGLPEGLARHLHAYLNSPEVNACFMEFSGSTQVNVADLHALRYPFPTQ